MARMEYNRNPVSLREGKIFIDGVECCDSVKAEIKFTPDVWTGRQLGDTVPSSRWLGATITGSITRRRSTPWLKEIVTEFLRTKTTPEFTIQGIMDDQNSDYYAVGGGSETITCVGCVLTGDVTLLSLDSGGEILDDSLSFNAKDIV